MICPAAWRPPGGGVSTFLCSRLATAVWDRRFRLSYRRASQNQVGLPGRGPFDPPPDECRWAARLAYHVNMVRHDDPGPQPIPVPFQFPGLQSWCDQSGYRRVSEPEGAGGSLIREAVQGHKDSAGPALWPRTPRWAEAQAGQRTCQTPRQKHEGSLWLPMGEMSAIVEHSCTEEGTGETACPTRP